MLFLRTSRRAEKTARVPAHRRDDQLRKAIRATLPGDAEAPGAALNRHDPQRIAVSEHSSRRLLAREAAAKAQVHRHRAADIERKRLAAPPGSPGVPKLTAEYNREMSSSRAWIAEGQLHGRKARAATGPRSPLAPPVVAKPLPAGPTALVDTRAATLDLPAPKSTPAGRALLAPVSRTAKATVQSTPSWARMLQHAITRH